MTGVFEQSQHEKVIALDALLEKSTSPSVPR